MELNFVHMSALSYDEQKRLKQKASAHHEAGHIFMLSLFGYTVTDASINEDTDEGETNYTPRIDPASLEDTLDKLVTAYIATAGVVAEARFRDVRDPSVLFYDGGLSDLQQFTQTGLSKDFIGPMFEAADRILSDHEDVISNIADELYRKKRLSQAEIEAFLTGVDFVGENKKYIGKLSNIKPDPDFFAE